MTSRKRVLNAFAQRESDPVPIMPGPAAISLTTAALASVLSASGGAGAALPPTLTADLRACNGVWRSPSKDSFESMPLPGVRGAGANVWVQDGALWIYLAHNGAYDESGALLKLGALRLKPVGVDWREPAGFLQERR